MLKSILLLTALSTSLFGQIYTNNEYQGKLFYGILVEQKDTVLVGKIVTKTVTNWHTVSLTTPICDGLCTVRHNTIHNQVGYIQTNIFVKFEFEGKSHEYQLKNGEEFETKQKREVVKNWLGEFEPFKGSIFDVQHQKYNPTNWWPYIITNTAITNRTITNHPTLKIYESPRTF